ncbi:MAG: ATP synthase F1 subunit delta [Deferrisomatales bacterium]
MIRTRIAHRYALALFELAQEAGKTAEVGSDLQSVAGLLATEEELRTALLSPVLPRSAKAQVLAATTEAAGLLPLTASFLRVLLEARKLPFVPDVAAVYGRMADAASGRVRGEAVTAMPLEDADVAALSEALGRAVQKEVILTSRQDPEILGGVVARVGNLLFDGSLRTQLNRMKETLLKG